MDGTERILLTWDCGDGGRVLVRLP